MTPGEATALLAVAAAFDNRKPDPDAAKAWSVALGHLPFLDCRDAVIAHYRKTNDWLMPSHVIAAVKTIRASRLEDAPPLTPPPGLDPLGTCDWLRAARRHIADGGAVDSDAAYGELKARHLPDLRALLPALDPTPADPERAALTEGSDA